MKKAIKIFSSIIIFSYLIIISQNTIAYLYFKIQQNYIVKNLCVQKDIENNLCMGHCYLTAIQKRLSQKRQSNNTATPVKYSSSVPIQEFIINKSIIPKVNFSQLIKFNKRYNVLIRAYPPSTPPPQKLLNTYHS